MPFFTISWHFHQSVFTMRSKFSCLWCRVSDFEGGLSVTDCRPLSAPVSRQHYESKALVFPLFSRHLSYNSCRVQSSPLPQWKKIVVASVISDLRENQPTTSTGRPSEIHPRPPSPTQARAKRWILDTSGEIHFTIDGYKYISSPLRRMSQLFPLSPLPLQ